MLIDGPEGVDAGTLIMCGLKKEHVLDSVRVVLEQHDGSGPEFGKVSDYESRDVSKKFYVPFSAIPAMLNRTVWRRQ